MFINGSETSKGFIIFFFCSCENLVFPLWHWSQTSFLDLQTLIGDMKPWMIKIKPPFIYDLHPTFIVILGIMSGAREFHRKHGKNFQVITNTKNIPTIKSFSAIKPQLLQMCAPFRFTIDGVKSNVWDV